MSVELDNQFLKYSKPIPSVALGHTPRSRQGLQSIRLVEALKAIGTQRALIIKKDELQALFCSAGEPFNATDINARIRKAGNDRNIKVHIVNDGDSFIYTHRERNKELYSQKDAGTFKLNT